MQRLRVTFSRGDPVKYISHLDLMRFWERALRRAAIPLSYSEGFNPHPRISLASPLAIGVTGECELMDVWLRRKVSSYFFIKMMTAQLPPGVGILKAEQVALTLPSLQSLMRQAEYRVELETDKGPEAVEAALRLFLAAKHIPWQHERDTGVRQYDIRALVHHLWLVGWQDSRCVLGMRLRSDSTASGRPEQVTAALGFPQHPWSVHRSKLILAGSVAEPDRNQAK